MSQLLCYHQHHYVGGEQLLYFSADLSTELARDPLTLGHRPAFPDGDPLNVTTVDLDLATGGVCQAALHPLRPADRPVLHHCGGLRHGGAGRVEPQTKGHLFRLGKPPPPSPSSKSLKRPKRISLEVCTRTTPFCRD